MLLGFGTTSTSSAIPGAFGCKSVDPTVAVVSLGFAAEVITAVASLVAPAAASVEEGVALALGASVAALVVAFV